MSCSGTANVDAARHGWRALQPHEVAADNSVVAGGVLQADDLWVAHRTLSGLGFTSAGGHFHGGVLLASASGSAGVKSPWEWDPADIYASADDWRSAADQLSQALTLLERQSGRSPGSGEDLALRLNAISALHANCTKLEVYGWVMDSLDMGAPEAPQYRQRTQAMRALRGKLNSLLIATVLQLAPDRIAAWMVAEPSLQGYKHLFDQVERLRAHSLPEKEEALLAQWSESSYGAFAAYETFRNVEMPRPEVTFSDGTKLTLTDDAYAAYRAMPGRQDRETLFRAYWGSYAAFQNTFAGLLSQRISANVAAARSHGYSNSLEAALFESEIEPVVYQQLLEGLREGLPIFHRYLRLRKSCLGVERLGYEDMHVPLVPEMQLQYSPAEGQRILREALAPLGLEYQAAIDESVRNRWVDFLPRKGKRQGSHMKDAPGVHPYVLLNWTNDLRSLVYYSHEMGHAVHFAVASHGQPYAYAAPRDFVTEVASQVNTLLVLRCLVERARAPEEKKVLLGEMLDLFRTVIFRQGQMSEFEQQAYAMVERGEPLTAESLNSSYAAILRKYYGHDQGVTTIDDRYQAEWASMPHLYLNYYFYQYATGFVAAAALAQQIAAGAPGASERYIKMLRRGSSMYPVDILREAGVDLGTAAPYRAAMKIMNGLIDEIEALRSPGSSEEIIHESGPVR